MRGSVRLAAGRSQQRPVRRRERLGQLIEVACFVLGLVALVGGVALARGATTVQRPALTVGAGPDALPNLQSSAADHLAAALAKGGSGISFQIVQRSTMHAKPGGPKIPVPDPIDRTKTIGMADEYFLIGLTERGIATTDGFYAEIRPGPGPEAKPDWTAEVELRSLLRDGVTYRDDGDGWYATDDPPGIGIDPKAYKRLASLLRNASSLADAGVDPADASLRDLKGTGRLDDIPGLVASDGKAFTKLVEPVTFALDPDGKLVSLHLVARNTNLSEFDLVVETDITLSYALSESLPEPVPALKGAQS